MLNDITTRVSALMGVNKIGEGSWANQSTGFEAFNDAGLECEVGEFMYSMVRLLKPEHVLETGTHHGVGAGYMGLALQDNKKGHLDTFEFLPPNYEIAKLNLAPLIRAGHVSVHLGDIRDFEPQGEYQFILLDTEPQTRFMELVKFFPHLSAGGYVFIHDLHRHMGQMPNEEHGFAWPWGVMPLEMRSLVVSGQLRPFHFANPRGLTGFYRVAEGDFKW